MFRNVTVNSVRKNHIPLLSNLLDQVCSKFTSAVLPLDYILQSYQIIKEYPPRGGGESRGTEFFQFSERLAR